MRGPLGIASLLLLRTSSESQPSATLFRGKGVWGLSASAVQRTDMAACASHRFEFRTRPEPQRRIEHAAILAHESASDSVRAAAERRADEVVCRHDVVTVVPADFFDQLLSALDREPQPNPALRVGAMARRTMRW